MAKYTIEDIEILRQKSGISYEEAVDLLEYHNGSLARALVDLEKNGRIKAAPHPNGRTSKPKGVFNFLHRLRIKVNKDNVGIINLSSWFVLLVLATAPHIAIVGLIVALVLGYRITIERDSKDFSSDTFDSMVRDAKVNVQHTVNTFAQQFGKAEERPSQEEATDQGPFTRPHTESPASGTRPVNVQFPDGGSVDVRDDGDGFHEADIQ